MAISLRLDRELERRLGEYARAEGTTKSGLLRALIQGFVKERARRPTAWELGREIFGKYGSGKKDLSVNRKKYLREILDAKHGSR